ncbi:major facilitator superfamily domain-containing protein [Aspergillus ambiguus]|uniref:major facilitator superfamily domain-containing protein n=1 Tax=Aspergillus ambiguus TaxID=176160 RepID=UPI003CCE167E
MTATKEDILPAPEVSHQETVGQDGKEGPSFTVEEEKRVYRKLDWNLMPLIFVLYSLSVLDRANLGNAKIAGMEDDIDLSGRRYDWLATVFYIAYILSQWTTIGWKAFPPHIWVAAAVFLWGFISTIQAACTSWAGLMVCRVLLGVIEAMYGPGVPLYLSFFYPREKLGLRTGIFLSGAALANAYGGALAYGISQAKASIGSWRILFIVEGVPSVLLAGVAWFTIPDSPHQARFLTDREREIAIALSLRQPGDRESSGLQIKQVLGALLDYKSYPPALMYFGCNVCFASLPLFVPTIISEMGAFTEIQSNGLSAPPYVLCWIMIVACAVVSDRINLRGPFVVGAALVAAIGYILLATQTVVAVRYFGLFLATQIFVSVALILTWVGNTHATDSKRAGGLAILATGGQCGPILGTNIFPETDAPYYRQGMWVSCGACLIVVAMGTLQMFFLWSANRRRDRAFGRDRDAGGMPTEYGDDRTFRYTV